MKNGIMKSATAHKTASLLFSMIQTWEIAS